MDVDSRPSQHMQKSDPTAGVTKGAKIALLAGLALYGIYIIKTPGHFGLLDNVDLAIHETGHLVFAPFGEFMAFLGGTLFQLIVPLTFFGSFIYRGDRYAASVMLFWVAQNLWNISVYVKDAQAQVLPLVGGGEHDWAYILGRLGWIRSDHAIGQAIFVFGVVLFAMGVLWGSMNVRPQKEPASHPGR